MKLVSQDDSWIDVLAKAATISTLAVVIFSYFYTVKPAFDKQLLETQKAELTAQIEVLQNNLRAAEKEAIQMAIVQVLNGVTYSTLDKISPKSLYERMKMYVEGQINKSHPGIYKGEALQCVRDYLSSVTPEQYERYGAVKYYKENCSANRSTSANNHKE